MQEAKGLVPDSVIATLSQVLGYKDFSPIQKEVIRHMKESPRNNFIAKAKNGSGKSLALTITTL